MLIPIKTLGAATANRILASGWLFRVGIIVWLVFKGGKRSTEG